MENLDNSFHISRLIVKSFQAELNEKEKKELQQWIEITPHNEKLYHSLAQNNLTSKRKEIQQLHPEKSWSNLENQINFRKNTRYLSFLKYAAVILLALSGGLLFYFHQQTPNDATTLTVNTPTPEPGSAKAILILESGEQVELTHQQNFHLQQDSSIQLDIHNNVLRIKIADSLIPASESYSTLAIPKGGEYQLVLSDGSKIWLNSDSRLRFPSSFNGNQRTVYLEGEAYFEVAHRPQQPFIVSTKEIDIQVLGTKFNVKAYSDDPLISTTLVSGSVRTSCNQSDQSVILLPNEQCIFDPAQNTLETHPVNPQVFLGWVQGRFIFENETLGEIMKQLSRWYDVEILYRKPQLAQYHFTGNVDRFDNISTLLRMIEKTYNITFNINGRTIVVNEK